MVVIVYKQGWYQKARCQSLPCFFYVILIRVPCIFIRADYFHYAHPFRNRENMENGSLSFRFFMMLWNYIHPCVVMVHWWKWVSTNGISSNIFSLMTCNAASTVGCSLSNWNVWVKITAKTSSLMVPHRSSYEVYQLLATFSKVCMNRWTHSCHGYSYQIPW